MPSPAEARIDVQLVRAHMAASVGVHMANEVVDRALVTLRLREGPLTGADADRLLEQLGREPGLIGLAAKVTRQMLKHGVAPLKPAF